MKKLTKHYSQHMYLFVIYGLFIVCLLGIFFLFTYHHYKKNTLEDASKDLENMCASVENSVEMQLDTRSSISMNLVYSNAIKTNFKEFSDIYRKKTITNSERVTSHDRIDAIHDIITAIIGAYQSASAINLYSKMCIRDRSFTELPTQISNRSSGTQNAARSSS